MLSSHSVLDVVIQVSLGITLIFAVGLMAGRRSSTATAQAFVWRAAVGFSLCLLVLVVTGTSAGVHQLLDRRFAVTAPTNSRQPATVRNESFTPLSAAQSAATGAPSPEHVDSSLAAELPLNVGPQREARRAARPPFPAAASVRPASEKVLAPPILRHRSPDERPEPIDYGMHTAVAWVCGTAIFLIVGIVKWIPLLRIHPHFQPASADATKELEHISRQMGVRRAIRLSVHPAAATPFVMGTFRPVIVIPPFFEEEFDRSQRSTIFAHELNHIQCYDNLWLQLSGIVAAALWWCPTSWLLSTRLRAAIELAADEASVFVSDGPRHLADCLVIVGRRLAEQPRFGLLGMAGGASRSSLARRVQRLLALENGRSPSRAPSQFHVRIGILSLFLFSSVLPGVFARVEHPIENGETSMQLLSRSWQRSLLAGIAAAFITPAVTANDEVETEVEVVLDIDDDGRREREVRRNRRERSRDRDSRQRSAERHVEEIRAEQRHLEAREEALQDARAAVKDQLSQLRRQGVHAEVQRELQEQLRDLTHDLDAARRERVEVRLAQRRERDERRDRDAQRQQHIHAAIENLRAAGLDDYAQRLARELDHDSEERVISAERAYREARTRAERAEVSDFRRDMEEMRHELEEMRRMLHDMIRGQSRRSARRFHEGEIEVDVEFVHDHDGPDHEDYDDDDHDHDHDDDDDHDHHDDEDFR